MYINYIEYVHVYKTACMYVYEYSKMLHVWVCVNCMLYAIILESYLFLDEVPTLMQHTQATKEHVII